MEQRWRGWSKIRIGSLSLSLSCSTRLLVLIKVKIGIWPKREFVSGSSSSKQNREVERATSVRFDNNQRTLKLVLLSSSSLSPSEKLAVGITTSTNFNRIQASPSPRLNQLLPFHSSRFLPASLAYTLLLSFHSRQLPSDSWEVNTQIVSLQFYSRVK